MFDETREYIEYLKNFNILNKPKMPNFDLSAYTDNEYLKVVESLNLEYDLVDDLGATLTFLKGE